MVFLTSEHGKGWRIMPTPWNWQGKRWSITPTPWKWLRSRGREKMRHWGRELTRVDHCLAFYLHPCRGPSSRSFKIHTCRKIIFHLIKRFWDLNMSFSTWFLTLIWMCVCVCVCFQMEYVCTLPALNIWHLGTQKNLKRLCY